MCGLPTLAPVIGFRGAIGERLISQASRSASVFLACLAWASVASVIITNANVIITTVITVIMTLTVRVPNAHANPGRNDADSLIAVSRLNAEQRAA
jgi:hypothetical protein